MKYGTGLVRTSARNCKASAMFDDITSIDSGFNVGSGAHFFATTHFGIRADLRDSRGFESLDDEDPLADNPFFDQAIATEVFNIWRGSVGLSFRW